MIPPHVYVQETEGQGDRKQRSPAGGCRTMLDYSYFMDLDLFRIMEMDNMSPIRRGSPLNRSPCYWRDQKPPHMLPQPIVVPYMRNSVVFNTTTKTNNHSKNDNGRNSPEVSSQSDSEYCFSARRDDASCNSSSSSSEGGTTGHTIRRTQSAFNKIRDSSTPLDHHHNNYQGNRKYQNSRRRSPNNDNNNNNYNGGHHHIKSGHHTHYRQHYDRRYLLNHHIPPDRFLAKADKIELKITPRQLDDDSKWSKLSKEIWYKFLGNQQTSDTFRQKILLWRNLFIFIRSNFPRYGLFLVGSTMSGFGSEDSDVDMCLLVRHTEMNQRNEALCHLGQVLSYLTQCEFVRNLELIQAKVPILKFQGFKFQVDLNCNNAVGIRNTHMLYCYSRMDWRVRPLVLIVKLWAAAHNINDAKNMTVSSYSLTLMMIHFLQCGVKPAVLPCLHSMYSDKFKSHSDIVHIDMHEKLPHYQSDNTEALGALLLGFLQYYTTFDFNTFAVSVRLADKIPIEECKKVRTYKNDPHQWKYLCIEEPFDLTNTARSVYDHAVFERIKNVFKSSYEKLNETHQLDAIFENKTV